MNFEFKRLDILLKYNTVGRSKMKNTKQTYISYLSGSIGHRKFFGREFQRQHNIKLIESEEYSTVYFPLISGFSIAIHIRFHHHFSSFFFWVLASSGSLTVASGLLSAKFFLRLKLLVMQQICCLHKHLSQQLMWFFVQCLILTDWWFRLLHSFISYVVWK